MSLYHADVGNVEDSFSYDNTLDYSDGSSAIDFRGKNALLTEAAYFCAKNARTIYISHSSNDLTFTDPNNGTKTLSQIINGGGGSGNFSSLTIDGTLLSGNATLLMKTNLDAAIYLDALHSSVIYLKGGAGYARGVQMCTGDLLRWYALTDSDAESGSDVGSTYKLQAYTDAGAYIDTPFSIVRASAGDITLARNVVISTGKTLKAGSNTLISSDKLNVAQLSGAIPLDTGGTGTTLSDPGADRLWGWDETDGSIKWIILGTGLSYSHATHTLSATGAGDMYKADNLSGLANYITARSNLGLGTANAPTFAGLTIASGSAFISGSSLSPGYVMSLTDLVPYNFSPSSSILFRYLYSSISEITSAAKIIAAKENGTDGNNASYFAIQTMPNGGSLTERLRISSAGVVTLSVDLGVSEGGTGASDASGARSNLGLVIGSNVQAYDAELAAIAGLVSAADRLPYFTGSGTASLATFTNAGRALLDDADAAAQRTTLQLGTIATQAANNVAITGGAIDGTAIGGTTKASGKFTTLEATGNVVLGDSTSDRVAMAGATAATYIEVRIQGGITLYKGTARDFNPGTVLDVQLWNDTNNSRFIAGQGDPDFVMLRWNYNATAASAYAALDCPGGQTLKLQSSGGSIECVGALLPRLITSTSVAGKKGEIAFIDSTAKLYVCTATGSPATWSALN